MRCWISPRSRRRLRGRKRRNKTFQRCSSSSLTLRQGIAYGGRNDRCSSLPRGGGGLGWGRDGSAWRSCAAVRTTPTPTLPQLGGGRTAAYFFICDSPAFREGTAAANRTPNAIVLLT